MLKKIRSPKDLKNIKEKDLLFLSCEIRKYICKIIKINGGHLASNLGAIELTIAMHRSFDSPNDKLIFDVGHQSYTHKILTGRYNSFKSIRKFKGISGFPKNTESEYDSFNTGHASTSISAALGMATARDIKKENFYVISYIGDGAFTGGMALEALNHLGQIKSNVIVVLNDNDMSISENIGAISIYLNYLTSKKTYRKLKESLNLIFLKSTYGIKFKKILSALKGSIKYIFSKKSIFFEQLGFTYLGPYDGHDIIALEEGFKIAKEIKGPVLFHAITKKGKGNFEAENNPEKFHGISPKKENKNNNLTQIFSQYLVKLAKKNKKITAITAAMSIGTGLNLFKKIYPERFFDVSIAEQHALTFAAGQSSQGLHPVVAIYSTFMQRAVDQVIHDICIQNLPVTMILDRAGLVGEDGETHHGVFDICLFGAIPNLVFMEPKDDLELKKMLDFSIKYKGPSMIRFSKKYLNIKSKKTLTNPIELGSMEFLLKNNSSFAIISLGTEKNIALKIAKKLKEKNINIDVINARFIKPINKQWINKLNNYDVIFTIENHVKIGGFGSILKSQLNCSCIINFGLPNIFIQQGTIKELRKSVNFTSKFILESILKYLNDK